MLKNLPDNPKFYFAHSFFASVKNTENVIFICDYGGKFVAGIKRDNIYGVQFHPEKSHKYGMALLRNLVNLKRYK